ncbi:MAG: hypothetical protein O3A01_08120 [bacterium]|nr:hypothetical protein [bacterium]
MKKQILRGVLCLCLITQLSTVGFAQKATDIPNISVIGNFLYQQPEHDDADFSVQEIEFAFQHTLYPGIRADIFVALHEEENETEIELEEAYLTLDNLVDAWVPNLPFNPGIGAIIGKKFIDFGKWNSRHPEQWKTVDRPLPLQAFLGGTEGLAGEGFGLNYTVPTPFFLQLQIGSWALPDAHAEDEHGHGHEGAIESVQYDDPITTARLWSSVAISDHQELEFGASTLQSNSREDDANLKRTLNGADLTYTYEIKQFQYLQLNAEYFNATYADELGESPESQHGQTFGVHLRFNKGYDAGIRYDILGEHGSQSDTITQTAFYTTRQLTDTFKVRLQYTSSPDLENVATLQFIFGMGPHSHVLQ